MNRLQKFVEQGPYGEKPARIAIAIDWKSSAPTSPAALIHTEATLAARK
jgi:hypothetical protein